MFKKVLRGFSVAGAAFCLFAVLAIVGAIENGGALEMGAGAVALTAAAGVFIGFAYLLGG